MTALGRNCVDELLPQPVLLQLDVESGQLGEEKLRLAAIRLPMLEFPTDRFVIVEQLAADRVHHVVRVTLDESVAASAESSIDLIALDQALEKLAALDPRQARVVELRFFGGLEVEEMADVLEVSPATVKRDWRFARAFLQRELEQGG